MKIYILEACHDYEGFDIVGVFDSLEKAIECKKTDKSHCDGYEIEEWDIQ